MANQARGFGMSAQVKLKLDGKRDPELENRVKEFIEYHVGEKFASDDYQESLKDGVLLCKLVKKFCPAFKNKIETGNMAFKQRSNVENFVNGCKLFGLKEMELFQVNDLFEGKNIAQVTACVTAFGRHAQSMPGYVGPILGPKQSKVNKREFTDEQLQAGKYIHGLQYGSNKGATQAGQNFGKPRQIFHDQ